MRAMPTAAHSGNTLSIALVLYNSDLALVERTLCCLEVAVARALAAGVIAGASLEVIDNASAGGYPARAGDLVRSRQGRVAGLRVGFREAAANRGYGAGHNLALAAADSEFHLVLNPDVEMAESALAEGLAYLRATPDVALLAPSAKSPDGEVEHLCKRYPTLLVLLLRASGLQWLQRLFHRRLADYELRELAAAQAPVPVPLASGCCMLARTDALRGVGGFDERFFLYFEDYDLSLRLASRGRVEYHPHVHIVHHGGYAARKGWKHVRMFLGGGLQFFRLHGWRWW